MKKSALFLIVLLSFVFAQNEDILLGKHNTIFSKSIGEEREYYVSLPRSYENSSKEYPVLYMMDGDWNFSEGLIGGIRYLEMLQEIPELIIVAIKNTNRSRDVFPYEFTRRNGTKGGGGANNYLSFLNDELAQLINNNYRVSSYKIFYGTSNSALTGVYDLLGYKKNYDAYICASPTIHWSFINRADSLIDKWQGQSKYINLIVGENDYVGLPRANAELKEKLQRKRITKINLKYTILEGEGHVPQTSLIVGLKDLFSGFKFQKPLIDENYAAYIEHFNSISKKYKTEFIPSENVLNRYAYGLLGDEKTRKKSLEVFKYMVEKYPNSSNAYDSLGEAYMICGQNKLAIKNYEKSLELNPRNDNAVSKISEIKSKM